MYLKSLEIHGFKSFPNRTVMTFEPGTTVVVGPNGSGKSNISDAMRWVLGEVSSRNIRGTTMEDVIFGGTDARRPMGYAEVSVCFDNTDPNYRFDVPYDEVTVTRRYYRGGTSEYLINNKPCLRKDVHELFMNTGIGRDGYSIIGQGKVAELISKKSEERRNIFEEAAGISKYRHRKHQAELKLDATSRNMETTFVQIAMYEEQLGPLEKEAEKARRGEAIKEEKKAVDVALWLYDTQRIHQAVAEARTSYETQKEDLAVLTAAVERLYAEREELDAERTQRMFRSEGILANINGVREQIHALDNRCKVIASEISHANAMIAQSEGRAQELRRQSQATASEMQGYEDARAGLQAQVQTISGDKLEVLSEQQGVMQRIRELEAELSNALKKLEELESSATSLRVRLDVVRNACKNDLDRSQALLQEIAGYEEARERLTQEAALCERNAAGFKTKIEEQDAAIEAETTLIQQLTQDRAQCAEEIGALRVEQSTKRNRANDLQRMVEQMEGFSRSVKAVMSEYEAGHIEGVVYGPLSNLVTINAQYVTAIEMALGSSAQNIVTDTDHTAKAAIEALKRTEKGRATFLPISTIKPGAETEEIRLASTFAGYVARADKLVECEEMFRPIVEWLLSRTVVFDTLENAVRAAHKLHHKVRLVTLDGQIMNVGGSMTGGSVRNEGTGILARNGEIAELLELVETLGGKIIHAEGELRKIDAAIEEAKARIGDAEQNKELLYSMSRSQFAALDSANARLAANENILEKLQEDVAAIEGMQSVNQGEIKSKEAQLAALESEIASLRSYRTEIDVRISEQLEEKEALQSKVQSFDIHMAEVARDIQASDMMIESARQRLNAILQDLEQQENATEEYRQTIRNLDSENHEDLTLQSTLSRELEELIAAREDLQSGAIEFDRRLTEINKYIQIKENEKNLASRAFFDIEARYTQYSEEQERLSVRLYDEYGMSYEDAVAANYPPVTPENEKEMRQTAISCYNRLRNIGGYSPTAITDYLDIKAKYDEVNGQYLDLKNSYNNLLEIIRKLEDEMATTFVQSFEKINENFGVVFRELFGGGTAELSLSDPENVLTSGIEIKVAPPGKNIRALSLLSGGEQSFVAIALFFSILKLHPTPFCILDEVEAALDEVNVYRFGEYIKRFCADTQFILITHRRGTMQIADRLYGVTMQEKGISKVICVDIAEVESKKQELTDTD